MINEVLKDADHKMDQAVVHTIQEFGGIRTGRANPGLLNRVTVDYYGTQTQLQQIAGFSVPEARLLVTVPLGGRGRRNARLHPIEARKV